MNKRHKEQYAFIELHRSSVIGMFLDGGDNRVEVIASKLNVPLNTVHSIINGYIRDCKKAMKARELLDNNTSTIN